MEGPQNATGSLIFHLWLRQTLGGFHVPQHMGFACLFKREVDRGSSKCRMDVVAVAGARFYRAIEGLGLVGVRCSRYPPAPSEARHAADGGGERRYASHDRIHHSRDHLPVPSLL